MPTAKTAIKKVAKKAVKKTASKKATAKKVSPLKVLVCAEGAQCFWTTDGTILRDLRDLAEAFRTMEDTVYRYHVSAGKHDFADWVEYVLEDAVCADALRGTKKPATAHTLVVRHLQKTYRI
jgi:hypothetical protein